MPSRTASTFGAVLAIRRLISSCPPAVYWSLHGESVRGVSVTQSSAMLEKPMSLPPIVSVTATVFCESESNWGGFGPGSTFCVCVMWFVFAPRAARVAELGERPRALHHVDVVVVRLQAAVRLDLERDDRSRGVRVAQPDVALGGRGRRHPGEDRDGDEREERSEPVPHDGGTTPPPALASHVRQRGRARVPPQPRAAAATTARPPLRRTRPVPG